MVENTPQNSRTITVSYDGWALVECIAYWQENFVKRATSTLKEVSVKKYGLLNVLPTILCFLSLIAFARAEKRLKCAIVPFVGLVSLIPVPNYATIN